jgi:hypothetical protein
VASVRAVSTNPFRISIRAWTSRRDPHRFDAGAGQGRIGRRGELPGPVADQEPDCRGTLAGVRQESGDLLGGPRPVRVCGGEDVHGAGADLDHDQAGQVPGRDRAVPLEEVRGEHRCGVHVQQLPPCPVRAPAPAGSAAP